MKKIAITLMMLLLVNGVSDGAVSDDVYVRKDVYEANMQGMNTKLDMILELIKEQREEMKAQREEHKAQMKELKDEMNGLREEVKVQVKELKDEMNGIREEMKAQVKESQEEHKAIRNDIAELTRVVSVLSTRVDGVDKRMDSLDKRIDDLRNGIYLWLVAIGLVIAVLAWPKVQDKLPKWGKATPSITLEDVKRLIEENNARMAGKLQA